jgi:hypothetical protein
MPPPPYQSQEIWNQLSLLAAKDTLKREITELLYGAAWHFELAEKIAPFSSDRWDNLLGNLSSTLAYWLEQNQAFSHPLTDFRQHSKKMDI